MGVELAEEISQGDKAQFTDVFMQFLATAPSGVQSYFINRHKDKLEPIPKMDLNTAEPTFNPDTHVLIYNDAAVESVSKTIHTRLESTVRSIVQKLDAGLGHELLKGSLGSASFNQKHRVITTALVLMSYGTNISNEDINHIRQLGLQMRGSEGCARAVDILGDYDLRGPGKRQLLAALDRYKPGHAQDFTEKSCHTCGKVNDDLVGQAKKLMRCGACKNPYMAAYFCDRECQKTHWKHHKSICGTVHNGAGFAVFSDRMEKTSTVNMFKGVNV